MPKIDTPIFAPSNTAMNPLTLDAATHKCQNEFVRSFMKNMEEEKTYPSETLLACLGTKDVNAKDTQKILWSRMDFISRGIIIASRVRKVL